MKFLIKTLNRKSALSLCLWHKKHFDNDDADGSDGLRDCNDPKFSDRYASANSADPDQTAPLSGSTLFAILSASFRLITLW